MKMLLTLAWRNIWRNTRRSILTILAVMFATLLSVAMRGVQIGTYELNITNAVRMFSGYVQIQRRGYQKNPSLQLNFSLDSTIVAPLKQRPAITAFSRRVYGDGLASFRHNSLGVILMGIDPTTETNVSTFQSRLNDGTFFISDSTTNVVVGYKLLKNLNASLGDKIVLLAQAADGSLGNMKYTIVGTVKTGSPEFDGMTVFMGLDAAQELLGMNERVHAVAISLKALSDVEPVTSELNTRLQGTNLSALPWGEVLPDLKSHLQMDNYSGIIFLGILIVIVAFGILNTVLMSVTERFREFGVTLSIGMQQRQLVALVFIETMLITLVGLIIGNVLAGAVNAYIVQHPILLGGELMELYEEYGFLPQITSTTRAHIFVNSSLSIFGISLVACLYPAYRVYRLEPLKGLRFT